MINRGRSLSLFLCTYSSCPRAQLISCRERWKHAEPVKHSLGLAKLTSCRSAEAGGTADAGSSSILQLGVDASFAAL